MIIQVTDNPNFTEHIFPLLSWAPLVRSTIPYHGSPKSVAWWDGGDGSLPRLVGMCLLFTCETDGRRLSMDRPTTSQSWSSGEQRETTAPHSLPFEIDGGVRREDSIEGFQFLCRCSQSEFRTLFCAPKLAVKALAIESCLSISASFLSRRFLWTSKESGAQLVINNPICHNPVISK